MIHEMKNLNEALIEHNGCGDKAVLNIINSNGVIGSKSFTKKVFDRICKINSSPVTESNCHSMTTRECWDLYFKYVKEFWDIFGRVGKTKTMSINYYSKIVNYFGSMDYERSRKRVYVFNYEEFIKFLRTWASKNSTHHSPNFTLIISRKNLEENGAKLDIAEFFIKKFYSNSSHHCIMIP